MRFNVEPTHFFRITFDFSQPPLFDWQFAVSAPTPNASEVTVWGNNDEWIRAVCHTVTDHLRNRRTHRQWLHRPFVYDLGLFTVGFPGAFLFIKRLYPSISPSLAGLHPVIEAAVYIYIGLFCLLVYRLAFSYTKWAFPKLELLGTENGPSKHRLFWYCLALSVAGAAIWALLGG